MGWRLAVLAGILHRERSVCTITCVIATESMTRVAMMHVKSREMQYKPLYKRDSKYHSKCVKDRQSYWARRD